MCLGEADPGFSLKLLLAEVTGEENAPISQIYLTNRKRTFHFKLQNREIWDLEKNTYKENSGHGDFPVPTGAGGCKPDD